MSAGNRSRTPRSRCRRAKDDLTAFAPFPERHWKKIQSTNPLERINREIKRRTDVVQVFPNDDALLRLVTAVLFELHDEWIAFPRRYLPEGNQLYLAELPEAPRTTQHAHRVIGYTTERGTTRPRAARSRHRGRSAVAWRRRTSVLRHSTASAGGCH